jgi:hypothetical protein
VRVLIALTLALAVTLTRPAGTSEPLPAPARELVVTIDDLPVGGTVEFTLADWERIT